MLKKVFKYEWKTITPLLLAIHAVGLAAAILCRIGIELMGGVDSSKTSIMAVLLLLIAFVSVGCISFYTYFYTGYRFYKNIFTQQGYLTNTLPVTADQLIWGKGLTGVIWLALTFVWAIIALFILAASPADVREVFHDLPRLFGQLFRSDTPAFAKVTFVSVLLSPFFMVIQAYVSAALGNLFTGHKLLATVGIYIGIYFLEQIVGILLLIVTAPHFATLERQLLQAETTVQLKNLTYGTLNWAMAISLVFSIIVSVVFYFLCRYVLNRRLNLE